MKKTTYYNLENPETELEFFINTKSEISIFISNGPDDYFSGSISLNKEDIEEIIHDLQIMLKQLEDEKSN